MGTAIILAVCIILALCLERIVAVKVTKSPRGCEFIRRYRIFHPNAISLVRMPMGLVSIAFGMMGWWPLAILWFALCMITDLTDGTIARNCDLQSETGKWLDPLSDKFMAFPPLLYFSFSTSSVLESRLNIYLVLLYIVIDTIGQMSRLFTRKKAANPFGKAKTALVTVLLALLAFEQLYHFIPTAYFFNIMMASCTILAFLSVYCKVIPDHWYANSLTLANFLCGLLSIFFVFARGWHARAFGLVFLGQFFDLFDGRMARKYGSTRLGAFFDDVADATSFGFAIASIIYSGLAFRPPVFNKIIAALTALFYLGCLIYRLYRFLKPTIPLPPGVFQGLPSPAGALAAGAVILVTFQSDSIIVNYIAVPLVLSISWLMISNIKYKHFGRVLWPTMPRFLKMLLFVVVLVFLNFAIVYRTYWEYTFTWLCLILGLMYIFLAVQRGKEDAVAEPQSAEQEP